MAYQIAENLLPAAPRPICQVDSLEAAEAWARDFANGLPFDPEVIFDIDAPNDAADIAIIDANTIRLFTVDPA